MQNIRKFIDSGIIAPLELRDVLAAQTNRPQANIKLIDGTYVMPGTTPSAQEGYQKQRIDNAVFFDIDDICDHTTDLPHMLPSANEFAAKVSTLGISNDDFIIVYGQNGMVMGPARVWWMFRVFGHDKVCVLDGGLPAWLAHNLPVTATPPVLPEKSANFEALEANTALVRSLAQIQTVCDTAGHCLLDARPAPRFAGQAPEPRPGLRSGHIPGSHNVPCMDLVDAQSGCLKPRERLQEIFAPFLPHHTQNIIATCGSGVTACMIALALFNLGQPDVAVYDGSWSEWGRTP